MSNAQGTAWTNNGWNNGEPFWRNTVDKDGNMIINTLMANKIKADCLEGGTIQGIKIIADDIDIRGGKINMVGEANDQLISMQTEEQLGNATITSIMMPRGFSVKETHGWKTNIDPGWLYVIDELSDNHISIQPTGISTAMGTAFYANPISKNIDWGNHATNNLKGVWYGYVNSVSDCNQKHDIEPLDERYKAFFNLLQPVRFIYNEQEDNRFSLGYIAQDVKAALEQAGLTEEDFKGYLEQDGIISLCYAQFTALNTAIIQEQQKQIDELKKRLDQLEKQV